MTSSISGRVVNDVDRDLTERLGGGFEAGLGGQRVQLVNIFGHVVATVYTDSHGNYCFNHVLAGSYRVVFPTSVGHLQLANQNVGDDGTDSDANQHTGSTDFFHVGIFQHVNNVDVVYGEYRNGPVDGSDAGQHMGVGFADSMGDRITDGADTIHGNGGHDTIRAGGGNDVVYGGNDNDYIEGNAGDDSIYGDAGDDNLRGNEGNDLISGGEGNDYAAGGTGDDTMSGGNGHDCIDGDDGNDTITLGEGNDRANGGNGNDNIRGENGDDCIVNGAGSDTVFGGAGNDFLDDLGGYDSTHQADLVFGDAGNDTIYGSAVGDTLFGGADRDFINGESGDDRISGGDGVDTLRGDGGNDTFVVSTAAEGHGDHITGGNGPDQHRDNDTLDLRGAGQVTINARSDISDAGARTGTVTFANGSVLNFSQIETILTDPQAVAPVAVNDSANTAEDVSVTINVLANDTDPNGDTLRVTQASAQNGTVTINANGTITYVPNANYNGTDTISYTVSDPAGNTAVGSVALAVEAVDDTPMAGADTADVLEDESVVISVLGNDRDADGDGLTVTAASAQNGTVTINSDGTLTYTPNPDFNGNDTITYSVADPDGNTATGVVSVSVEAVDDANGTVEGTAGNDSMGIGYEDADGDIIDGADGLNDVVNAGEGNDAVNAGLGNDLVDGGNGNDTLNGNDGSDTLNGNAGDDTFLASDGGDQINGGDDYDTYAATGNGSTYVMVNNGGNSSAELFPDGVRFFEGPASSVDELSSIERIVATENDELDKIAFGNPIGASEIGTAINGLSDEAIGFFRSEDGVNTDFGPDTDYRLSDILNGTAPNSELPAVGPIGSFVIFGNEEAGEIGGVSFEGFEEIFFKVQDDSYEGMMRSASYEDDVMPIFEEEEEATYDF